MELLKPTSAVETGRASIPPPIDVPTISKTPPISFELNTYIIQNSTNIEQYVTYVGKKSQAISFWYCQELMSLS